MLCLSAEARADRGASDHRSGASVATARYGFFGACALLFVASAAATVLACLAMAGMGEVPLAGGWSMSTSWTPLCGGAWGTAAAVFLGMWIVMTLAMMQALAAETVARWDLLGLTIIHRHGPLGPGAGIVFVATAARHRAAAFDACASAIDRLKTQAPFWKRETFADGRQSWVEPRASDDAAAARWLRDGG